jgi:hypothetical protein
VARALNDVSLKRERVRRLKLDRKKMQAEISTLTEEKVGLSSRLAKFQVTAKKVDALNRKLEQSRS